MIHDMSYLQNCVPPRKKPLVSICIPTFNRASCIETLFSSLQVIKSKYDSEVEVCVSNNSSTDDTGRVIDAWKGLLHLKVLTQEENIGATLNSIEVTKLATGRWIQIVGDDDAIIFDEFCCLMDLLQTQKPETWVLVGVTRGGAQEKYPRSGNYTSNAFQKMALKTSLGLYGFVGMHVIPASWLKTYHGLTSGSARGWPHLALFIRYLLGEGTVLVYKRAVVRQAVGPSVLFWKMSDWVRVGLGRIDLLNSIKKDSIGGRAFLTSLALRELYGISNVKNMILWKALEGQDFDNAAVSEYFRRYSAGGALSVFFLFHGMLLIFLRFASAAFIRSVLSKLGYGNILSDYVHRKATMTGFDGLDRGL